MKRSFLIFCLLCPLVGLLAKESTTTGQLTLSNISDPADGYKFTIHLDYFFQACAETQDIGLLHNYTLELHGYQYAGHYYSSAMLQEANLPMLVPEAVAPITLIADLYVSERNLGRIKLWHLYPEMQFFGHCLTQNTAYILQQLELKSEFDQLISLHQHLQLQKVEIASLHVDQTLESKIAVAWDRIPDKNHSKQNPLAPLTVLTYHLSESVAASQISGLASTNLSSYEPDRQTPNANRRLYYFITTETAAGELGYSSLFAMPTDLRGRLPYEIDVLNQFEATTAGSSSRLFGPYGSKQAARSKLYQLLDQTPQKARATVIEYPFTYLTVTQRKIPTVSMLTAITEPKQLTNSLDTLSTKGHAREDTSANIAVDWLIADTITAAEINLNAQSSPINDRSFTNSFLAAELAYDTGNFAKVVSLLDTPPPALVLAAVNHYYLLAKAWHGLDEIGKTNWALHNYFALASPAHFGYQEMIWLSSLINKKISERVPVVEDTHSPVLLSPTKVSKPSLADQQDPLLQLPKNPHKG